MGVIHHGATGLVRPTSDRSPFPVYIGDGASADAFGRLRVSEPVTIFDSSQEYGEHPLLFEHVLAGTGAATHDSSTNSTVLTTGGAADGARAFRQSRTYWRYQPGKSHLVKMTGTLSHAGTFAGGAYSQMGYGDDSNGVFARYSANGLEVVKRSDTTGEVVETVVPQALWNLDPLRGLGKSKATLDPTKSQILVIDLQWLAVGRVRIGFQFNGRTVYAHEFRHSNLSNGAYMRTANLPVRWEVNNAGAGADVSLEAICVAIESEGGFQDSSGYTFAASTQGTQVACADSPTLTPIMTLRLRDLFGGETYRGHARVTDLRALVSSNSAYWQLIWNATLTGATFTNLVNSDYSGVEFDTEATAYAGGVVVDDGYLSAGSGQSRLANSAGLANKLLMSRSYNNTRDTITLAARGVSGATSIAASIGIDELY